MDDELAYQEYLDSQSGIERFEKQAEQGWLRRAEYSPEAYEEMVRDDAEGRS